MTCFSCSLCIYKLRHDPYLLVLFGKVKRSVTVAVANVGICEHLTQEKLCDEFSVAVLCRIMEGSIAGLVSRIDVFFEGSIGRSRFLDFLGSIYSLGLGKEID